MNIEMSLDIYDPSTTVTVSLNGDHKHFGFQFRSDLQTPAIQDCGHGTPASNIECWRSMFSNANIRAINGEIINTIAHSHQQAKELRATSTTECAVTIAHEYFGNLHTAQGLPQIHFDQLQALAHHLNCIKYGDDYNFNEDQDQDATVMKAIAEGIVPHKFTRQILKQREDWTT